MAALLRTETLALNKLKEIKEMASKKDYIGYFDMENDINDMTNGVIAKLVDNGCDLSKSKLAMRMDEKKSKSYIGDEVFEHAVSSKDGKLEAIGNVITTWYTPKEKILVLEITLTVHNGDETTCERVFACEYEVEQTVYTVVRNIVKTLVNTVVDRFNDELELTVKTKKEKK